MARQKTVYEPSVRGGKNSSDTIGSLSFFLGRISIILGSAGILIVLQSLFLKKMTEARSRWLQNSRFPIWPASESSDDRTFSAGPREALRFGQLFLAGEPQSNPFLKALNVTKCRQKERKRTMETKPLAQLALDASRTRSPWVLSDFPTLGSLL